MECTEGTLKLKGNSVKFLPKKKLEGAEALQGSPQVSKIESLATKLTGKSCQLLL